MCHLLQLVEPLEQHTATIHSFGVQQNRFCGFRRNHRVLYGKSQIWKLKYCPVSHRDAPILLRAYVLRQQLTVWLLFSYAVHQFRSLIRLMLNHLKKNWIMYTHVSARTFFKTILNIRFSIATSMDAGKQAFRWQRQTQEDLYAFMWLPNLTVMRFWSFHDVKDMILAWI